MARRLAVAGAGPERTVATLVHDAQTAGRPRAFAVVYVHGWTDYFFNRELSDFWAEAGGAFYALDLHGSGRSLRAHQTPAFVTDLREYFPDIDAAVDFIRTTHPDLPLLLLAHSQGGLTAALWASTRRNARAPAGGGPLVDGLILNAPWLDQPLSPAVRRALGPVAETWGRLRPHGTIPIPSPRLYERVISAEFGGEWHINENWRPDRTAPAKPGWARAVLRAQNAVSRGLGLTLPILTLTSHASLISPAWNEQMRYRDIIIDVEQTWRQVPKLGRNFELIKVRDAVHDVFLSAPHIRRRAYDEVADWLARWRFR